MTAEPMPPAGSEKVDVTSLMADLEREVRARRASGELPEDFERELDAAFEAVAPPGATGTGYEAVVARAERAAFIDTVGPVESRLPGVPLVRRVLRKLLAFYVEHVARQVSAFATTLVRAVRLLGRRVDALEAASRATDPRVRAALHPLDTDIDVASWLPLVRARLRGASGRVLCAECGDGSLLASLAESGTDVYGVDPRPDAALFADRRGVEVRSVDALDHLRAVPDRALGGLVLVNCVDRLPLGELLTVIDRAAAALTPGSPMVVLSTHPGAFERTRSVVASDLSPGRPLHPDTWVHLLSGSGFADVAVHLGEPDAPLDATGDAPTDENFRRIGDALFGPPAFAVTAVRRDA